MTVAEPLGFLAGALVTGSIVPQIIRVFKLKSAREISFLFTTLMFLGVLSWLAYGIWLRLAPIIIWNAIGIALTGTLLATKLKYGR